MTKPTIPLQRNAPLYFKRKPTQFSQPDAAFSRDMGTIPAGDVCEIRWEGRQQWIVKYDEITTESDALHKVVVEMRNEIERCQKFCSKPTKTELALQLGISTKTLNRRLAFVKEHLPG